jgi:hypothetical protein
MVVRQNESEKGDNMSVSGKGKGRKGGEKRGFEFRGVLGAWANDISSVPRVEQWPSAVLDESLERDLIEYAQAMKESHLEYLILFGLFVTDDWQPDLKTTVSPQREAAVRRILEAAHARGVKVLYGLGLYSWGYDAIIRANPDVRGTNPHAMCGSREASHQAMRDLIDHVTGSFDFDGYQFESADRGRCSCDACRGKTDSEYHLDLNRRTAEYVRDRWPGKTIEVYCPIRRSVKEDWLIWRDASKLFDVFCDDYEFAARFGCESRREIASQFQCAYGSRSGVFTYPPQRWDRLRWFIPVIDKRAEHYRQFASDGGRAIMIQGTPLVNPAEEASLRCSGLLAVDPSRSVASVLAEVMEGMFRPRGACAAKEIADIFWAAEKAYWCNAHFLTGSGELAIEPLLGTMAGPPVYLESRMFSHDLANYEFAMREVQRRFLAIRGDLADAARVDRVARCLEAVLEDVARTRAAGRVVRYPVSVISPDSWTEEAIW